MSKEQSHSTVESDQLEVELRELDPISVVTEDETRVGYMGMIGGEMDLDENEDDVCEDEDEQLDGDGDGIGSNNKTKRKVNNDYNSK